MQAIIHLPTIKAIADFAATDDGRFYLNGVLIRAEATATTYVATDGHRLAARRMACGTDVNSLVGDFIVPHHVIKQLKSNRSSPTGILRKTAEGQMVIDHAAGGTVFAPIDGTFPAWEKIVPAQVEGSSRLGFNGRYIQSVWALAKALDLGAITTFTNGDGPATFGFHNEPDAFAVVMPYANPADAAWVRPAWVCA